ncbi:hypothetical protein HMPREF2898_03310 [Atopobium sp. HMSC064B08]|nr:hypothetical protein HMPREF2898_03310 [Atopobium sp. HMSC064B08]
MSKVIVFGSMNMDLSIETDRMPFEGETCDGKHLLINPGGKGANQAVASSRIGAHTLIIGSIGNDAFGEDILHSLTDSGVHCDEVISTDNASTGLAIVIRTSGDNRIIIEHGANYILPSEQVIEALDRVACPGDVFLTQFECCEKTTYDAIIRAKELGLYVIVNPSPVHTIPKHVFNSIDLLCLNETECMSLFGLKAMDDFESIDRSLSQLLAHEAQTIILTVGDAGSIVVTRGQSLYQQAFRVNTVDTTSAGDTYVGAMAACVANGKSLNNAAVLASKAAALATRKIGAQRSIPTLGEIERFFEKGERDD